VRLGGALALGALATLLAGCSMLAIPSWVPWLGTPSKAAPDATAAAPANPNALDSPKPGDIRQRPTAEDDEISDRIIAVVNNDAITLNELIESVAVYRAENRGGGGPSDEDLRKESLARLIDNRLQLQEADREKITVDEAELNEEFLDRIKRYNVKNEEEFEKLVRAQGVTLESIKKRLRDGLKVSKLVRRKVTGRISVTEDEISQYVEENRSKLETGLSYHARHILIPPEVESDTGWEAARIKADMLAVQLSDGADFSELARQHSRMPRPRTAVTWAPSSAVSCPRRWRAPSWCSRSARSPGRSGHRWATTSSGWSRKRAWTARGCSASVRRFATSYSGRSTTRGRRPG